MLHYANQKKQKNKPKPKKKPEQNKKNKKEAVYILLEKIQLNFQADYTRSFNLLQKSKVWGFSLFLVSQRGEAKKNVKKSDLLFFFLSSKTKQNKNKQKKQQKQLLRFLSS